MRALWFSPPKYSLLQGGTGMNGPLPRIFISELLVDEMTPQTQVCILEIIPGEGGAGFSLLFKRGRWPSCAPFEMPLFSFVRSQLG